MYRSENRRNTYDYTNGWTAAATLLVMGGCTFAFSPWALLYVGAAAISLAVGNVAGEQRPIEYDGGIQRRDNILDRTGQKENAQMALVSQTIMSTAARTALRPVAHAMLMLGVVADLVGYVAKVPTSIVPIVIQSDKMWNKIWKSPKEFTITHSLRHAFTNAHIINPSYSSKRNIELNRMHLNLNLKKAPKLKSTN